MATQKDGGLVARAVREAVGTLVSPAMYGQLVGRALQASGLTEIPESGAAIAEFIQGALLRELEQSVGADAAELVAEQLAPIVAHASASRVARIKSLGPSPARADKAALTDEAQRRQKPASAEKKPASATPGKAAGRAAFGSEQPTGVASAPATSRGRRSDPARTARLNLSREELNQLQGERDSDAPGATTRPESGAAKVERRRPRTQLFGASTDSDAISALGVYLMGTAQVSQVDDLVGLLDALEAPGLREPIVLLDCRKPTVNVSSVAAIGEDLPHGTTIVLWGASEGAWRELDRDRLPNCRWVRCSAEATTDDVGSLCQMLAGT